MEFRHYGVRTVATGLSRGCAAVALFSRGDKTTFLGNSDDSEFAKMIGAT